MAVLQNPDETILDCLRRHAQTQPDRLAYRFLRDNDDSATLTFGQLDRRIRALAARLRQGAVPGDRALLLYPPGLEFIEAFLGCLAAGVIAVPAYPPRRNRKAERLRTIAEDARPRLILTTRQLLPTIEASELGAVNGPRILATDVLEGENGDTGSLPKVTADTVAFLQYTSGSTGTPHGVVVSHGNLMANERAIQTASQHTQDDVSIGWLPVFHDMGLIGNVLQPLYVGFSSVLLSPVTFIREPVRWLQTISEYRGTTAAAPNFAFDHCIRGITEEQKQGLDLRSWRVAFNGSEPVRAETLDRFAEAFAECGFRPETLYPCYGLAEATLFVTGDFQAKRPTIRTLSANALEQGWAEDVPPDVADARALVSCGQPWQGQKIAIVNSETQTRCPEGRVGEIWVAGPSVAAGYWNRPEESERTFRAFLTDPAEGPFLRTGDLGFVRDGELFVTGRLKDVLIIRGRNHYPQDLEATVQSIHPALPAGGGAAFEIEADGEARLIVVQELVRGFRGGVAEILGGIRHAIAEQHGLQVHDFLFLEPGSLPKTSSGKVQRHACRAAYERGTLRRWKGT